MDSKTQEAFVARLSSITPEEYGDDIKSMIMYCRCLRCHDFRVKVRGWDFEPHEQIKPDYVPIEHMISCTEQLRQEIGFDIDEGEFTDIIDELKTVSYKPETSGDLLNAATYCRCVDCTRTRLDIREWDVPPHITRPPTPDELHPP